MVKHLQDQSQESYGTPSPLSTQFPTPIIARRAPTVNDTGYSLGMVWVDRVGGNMYGLTSNAGGVATWLILGSVSSTFVTITATNFVTATAATSTRLNGNTWAGVGTNAAINLVMTPKGAGIVSVTSGGITVTAGPIIATAGNITSTLGNITATAGNIVSTLGNITATAGNITATAGDIVSTLGNITATNGNITATAGNVVSTLGNFIATNGYLSLATAGNGIRIKEGANARMGQTTLVAGSKILANTTVTANTRVFATRASVNASVACGLISAGTITPGVSFVIDAIDPAAPAGVVAADVSIVDWILVEAT